MGLRIETTENGEYKIFDNMSDRYWSDNSITREHATSMLIEAEFRRFREKVIEIAMTFPNGYCNRQSNIIENEGPNTRADFYRWILDASPLQIKKKFKQIVKDYGIKFNDN